MTDQQIIKDLQNLLEYSQKILSDRDETIKFLYEQIASLNSDIAMYDREDEIDIIQG